MENLLYDFFCFLLYERIVYFFVVIVLFHVMNTANFDYKQNQILKKIKGSKRGLGDTSYFYINIFKSRIFMVLSLSRVYIQFIMSLIILTFYN